MNWQRRWFVKADRPDFLWSMVIGILVAGLVAGAAVRWMPFEYSVNSNSIRDAISMGWQAEDGAGFERMLSNDLPLDFRLVAIAQIANVAAGMRGEANPSSDETSFSAIDSSLLDSTDIESESAITGQLLISVAMGKVSPNLQQIASADPPVRHANQAIAAFHVSRHSFSSAAKHFEIEGRFPDAVVARQFALDTYAHLDDSESLMRLAATSQYEPLITASERLVIAEANRDWRSITWTIPQLIAQRFRQGFATALALVAGLGWLLIAIRMGQSGERASVRPWLCVLGVVMGGLSIWATHLIDTWQELDWGIVESDETFEGIKFYVLGVGLREELAKLLLLLPLMPLIIRRGSVSEALVVSACVGLGFAIVENMGYFALSGSTDSMGRFLTANFLHMSLTGLIGLAIARAIWKKHDISNALLMFLLMVLAHGFYDAAIAVPALESLSIGGTILFIVLSYQFFHEIRSVYLQRPQTISLTAIFLFVVSTLTAITFVYVSWRIGFSASIKMLSADVLGLSLMVYMYLREMPNSLIR